MPRRGSDDGKLARPLRYGSLDAGAPQDLADPLGGVARSQVIREAVEAYVRSDREAEIDQQIVDGYRRVPQGGDYDVDEWGDLGGMVTALSVESLSRLDEEERAAGIEPW